MLPFSDTLTMDEWGRQHRKGNIRIIACSTHMETLLQGHYVYSHTVIIHHGEAERFEVLRSPHNPAYHRTTSGDFKVDHEHWIFHHCNVVIEKDSSDSPSGWTSTSED